MQVGDVFTLDTKAIEETAETTGKPEATLREKLSEGDTFVIAKSEQFFNNKVVKASRWVVDDDGVGKPKQGRPRRFARATVARLLGEDDDVSLQGTEEVEDTTDSDLEAAAEALLGDDNVPVTDSTEATSDDSW